jgi:dienelactone hydrolase
MTSRMPSSFTRFALGASGCLLCLAAAHGVVRAADPPTNVEFQSDGRTLKGWIFKPEGPNLKGPFPAVIWNHGSDDEVHVPPALSRTYNDRGFVIFYPVRRYHYPSSNGKKINQLISEAPRPQQAWIRYNEEENQDVFNALAWLKKQPYVDPERIMVSGCSFGGVQTLLSAEKGGGFKVALAFAPGAMSWGDGHGPINDRLEQAVKNRKIPMFILQAHNDYSLGPSNVLGPLLDNVKLLHKVKQYPDFGSRTPGMTDKEWHQQGHGGFAMRGGDVWGPDLFAFVEEGLGPAGDTRVVRADPHGRPEGVHAGEGRRYQLWADAEGWHLRTIAGPDHEVHFRGTIAVKGGSLDAVHGVLTESKGKGADRWMAGPDQKSIVFDFATRDQDGMSFVVRGKDAMLSFQLEIGEDAPKFDADRVFIGKDGHHPKGNPFELEAH